MNYIGVNLKKLLDKENISENELSKRIGIPQQMINRITTGVNQNPKLSTIAPIANYFKIPLQELIYSSDLKESPSTNNEIKIPYVDFNIIEEQGIFHAISHTQEFITANLDKTKTYFSTRMHDESMEPKFSKDTILIFEQEREPLNGDFCLLKDEKDQYIFRQIMINSTSKKFIKCLNPTYDAYTVMPLPINIFVLATLLESRTSFSSP